MISFPVRKCWTPLRVVAVLALTLPLLTARATPVEGRTTGAGPEQGTIVFARKWPSRQVSYSHLFTVRPDGSAERPVWEQNYAGTPAWSPDGTKVAFSMTDGRSIDIYVMDVDGDGVGEPRRLFYTPQHHEWHPTWSPDGQRIAYVQWWVDPDAAPARQPRMESSIWTVRTDGSDRRRLTYGPSPHEQTPSWSPNGSWIAFGRRDHDESSSPWHIYVVRSDGKRIRRLTHGNMYSWGPAWSPDGNKIAFTGSIAGLGRISINQSGVFIIPARGGEPRYVTAAATHDTVCWSPDGTRLAYAAPTVDVSTPVAPNQQPVGNDLYSVSLDGSDPRQITLTPHASEGDCDWTAR